jgi:hypothetical protein
LLAFISFSTGLYFVITSEARDPGSCLHQGIAGLQTETRIPRFARDDNPYMRRQTMTSHDKQ